MNFLAHLYLACMPNRQAGNDEGLIVGNFIADAVKGNKYQLYPERISKGILMHRAIDSFTDNNAVYLQSVHRLQPDYGRYSGIIADMFYDYFLAANWDKFSSVELKEFCQKMYHILSANKKNMPEESCIMLEHMMKRDWLYSYSKIEGIKRSLLGMSNRMKYYFPMDNAAIELEKNPVSYNEEFLEFFPLLIEHIRPYMI